MTVRRVILASLTLAALAGFYPAGAMAADILKQGPVTDADIATAQSYAPWAQAFGGKTLVFVGIDEKRGRMMLEYLPADQNIGDWNEMVTISVIGLPDDKAKQGDAAFTYIDNFRKQIAGMKQQTALAVELKGFAGFTSEAGGDNPGDKPRHALYQFAIGEKTPDEDNAGVIFPAEGRLINFQLQRRNGKKVTENDLTKLQDFLMKQMGEEGATIVNGDAEAAQKQTSAQKEAAAKPLPAPKPTVSKTAVTRTKPASAPVAPEAVAPAANDNARAAPQKDLAASLLATPNTPVQNNTAQDTQDTQDDKTQKED